MQITIGVKPEVWGALKVIGAYEDKAVADLANEILENFVAARLEQNTKTEDIEAVDTWEAKRKLYDQRRQHSGPRLRLNGAKIKALRLKRFLTQGELAEALEVSANTIKDWESYRYRAGAQRAKRLAKFLGVELEDLIEEETK